MPATSIGASSRESPGRKGDPLLAKKVTFEVGRKAGNGQFTTVKNAEAHKNTMIVETITRKVS